ncbi:hypothetical protein KIW84_010660 [Lathyrus oleraceus]|uniref:Uncharacterized protein n=1 Tax=Pisum sativum TaxID=3888 RepID=A0A9D4YKL0_PEA|nr:hypothetical protein KIW84_010660 [Pisum sativum]
MYKYQESINKIPNMEEISKKILLDGREVERNHSGVAIRYRREDLIPEAQVLLLFILHNIRPRSHTSTFTMDTTQFLYLIMSESGKEFGTGIRSTCPLVFPDLIMGLLIASRVRIPSVGPFEIKTKDYGDWDLRLRQDFTYTWDQNDSNHGVVISLHDFFYRLHIHPRGKPDAGHHFMTPEEFQMHIAWPGDRPFYQGEAVGHKNEDGEEDDEAKEEEETSGGSKTASDDDITSDDDKEMGGE